MPKFTDDERKLILNSLWTHQQIVKEQGGFTGPDDFVIAGVEANEHLRSAVAKLGADPDSDSWSFGAFDKEKPAL